MSKSYGELERELEEDIPTAGQRQFYFDEVGMFAADSEIVKHFKSTKTPTTGIVSDGGKTDFYDIGDAKDVDDLAEHWDLRGDEFNCLKALVGIAKGSRHKGTTPMRDANKLVHYATRIQKRLAKQQKENT